MRVEDIFPPEVIDEDIKKWMGAAAVAGAIAASPMGLTNATLPAENRYDSSLAKDIAVMAQTMWGEARNHGTEGMLAVGSVIKNRAESDRGLTFGNGIQGVALKRKQFSCWNPGDPNRDKIEQMRLISKAINQQAAPDGRPFEEWFEEFKSTPLYPEYKEWLAAYQIARKIVRGQVEDPTKGALFYHTTNVNPKWAVGAEPVQRVANHVFYQKVN